MTTATDTGSPRTLLDYLQRTAAFFEGKGIAGARLDAELLLAEVLGCTRTQLYTNFEQTLGADEVDRYRELVRRRAAREPVAYITGRREFWSLDLDVDRRVLIPRPETELVVQVVVEEAARRGGPLRIADVGTGSGAIAVAVAKEVESAVVVATDLSEAALEIAPANAARHGVDARIEFRGGDGCGPLAADGAFDVIASNPPYVLRAEIRSLEPEVRDWEPGRALDGGPDGMDVTGPLVDAAFDLLVPGGLLVVEVGTQAPLVRDRAARRGYGDVAVRPDLAGLDRVVVARRPA